MKEIIIVIVGLLIVGGGIYYFNQTNDTYVADETADTSNEFDETRMPVEPDGGIGDGAEPLTILEGEEQIGQSVDGTPIMAHHYGTGEQEIVLIGGIHGGYSWNTALLGNQIVEYYEANADTLPDNVRVTVIPVVNPDGLSSIVTDVTNFSSNDVTATDAEKVSARFNSNDVDINRNFNCEWEETGTWQNREVSGGEEPFSEPESRAIRDYVESQSPTAVIAYYSAAGGVYASSCRNGILPETRTLTNVYAEAANYEPNEEFDFYDITGDMVNWLAASDVPAISVLLTDHENTELSKNLQGIEAVIAYYGDNE